MEYIVIPVAAFIISVLTFFSGFGMGTLLTPVFLIFFKPDVAIALTGIVHFFNNIFKLALVGKNADKEVLLKFGVPSVLAAIAGAIVLIFLADMPPLFTYMLMGKVFVSHPIKFTIGILLLAIALMELIPYLKNIQFGREKLVLGGLLSGFFGGLSGNQGALRSAFLLRAGLDKKTFIATAVVASTAVDIARLGVYSSRYLHSGLSHNYLLLIAGISTAIAGALLGNYILKKVTFELLHKFIAVLLIGISIGLTIGLI